MPIPEAFLEELRERLSLSDVVGRHVRLTRKGHEFLGLCPFHKEKTPSFTVNDTKGFYHCFGCQAHGSAFDFVMAIDGVGFRDAVERLAAQAGLAVPAETPAEAAQQQRRRSLHDLLEAAAAYYADALHSSDSEAARAYLKRRGVDAARIADFRLGYAPSRRAGLRNALGQEPGAEDDLIEAGLVIRPDDPAREPYDRFRDRLMFPISDARGRVVGFGGRLLGPGEPKYLNSPETPLFHKGRLLYGLDRAAAAARQAKTIIVVEGYMDVIGLAQAGYANVVAPLGTALTEEQLAALWRLVDEPILCFDPDAAGLRAAARAAERALPLLKPGKGLRFAILANDKNYDPGDIVRWDQTNKVLQRSLAEAAPLHLFLFRQEADGKRIHSPERRAALQRALDAHAQRIADRTMRAHYARVFRDMTWEKLRGYTQRYGRHAQSGLVNGIEEWQAEDGPVRVTTERTLLALVLAQPDLLAEVDEELGEIAFADPALDALRQEIVALACEAREIDPARPLAEMAADRGHAATIRAIGDDAFVKHASYLQSDTSLEAARRAWCSLVIGLTRSANRPARRSVDAKAFEAEWRALRAEIQADTEVEPD